MLVDGSFFNYPKKHRRTLTMFRYFNSNPVGNNRSGDCGVRALSKALGISWDEAFDLLSNNARLMGDMTDSKVVMTATLRQFGFFKENIPHTCPECLTVREFCQYNPVGTYILGTQSHIVTVISGSYYDIWDCGDEIVDCFWTR